MEITALIEQAVQQLSMESGADMHSHRDSVGRARQNEKGHPCEVA